MSGAPPPDPKVEVFALGEEREPLVVIDGFSGRAAALRAAGEAATYRDAGASYPGLRAPCDPSYLDIRRDLMMQVMQRVFGVRQGISCDAATYSIVTTPPDQLSAIQRLPHYDDARDELIAVMHYLGGPEDGGTAFYKHRATGYEAIERDREQTYLDTVEAEMQRLGPPGPAYHYGDSDRYLMTGAVEARPDRLVLYRGRLLHSGVIPEGASLSSHPAEGRLTINMFLSAR